MRRKATENGWGKSHNGNRAKQLAGHRHMTLIKKHRLRQPVIALKSHFKARGGVMIGNFAGPGEQNFG